MVIHSFAGWSHEALCNLTRPDKSLLLRAPLSKPAGGLELCGQAVFRDANDAGYQQVRSAILAAANQHQTEKRFDMPGFRPNQHYTREMQRFGFLPKDLAPDQPIDVYATDRAYWKSFWYRPLGK